MEFKFITFWPNLKHVSSLKKPKIIQRFIKSLTNS